jgi:hypothetical protein
MKSEDLDLVTMLERPTRGCPDAGIGEDTRQPHAPDARVGKERMEVGIGKGVTVPFGQVLRPGRVDARIERGTGASHDGGELPKQIRARDCVH